MLSRAIRNAGLRGSYSYQIKTQTPRTIYSQYFNNNGTYTNTKSIIIIREFHSSRCCRMHLLSFPQKIRATINKFFNIDQDPKILIEKAKKCMQEEKMDEAINHLNKAINLGSLEAKVNLALLYFTEINEKPIDIKKALQLAEETADQNNYEGITLLVRLYIYGCSTSYIKNDEEAIKLLEKAANEGNVVRAHELLGGLFLEGRRTQINVEKAKFYLQKVVDQDTTGLIHILLASCYKDDKEKQIFYLKKAAELKKGETYILLGDYYLSLLDKEKALYYYQLGMEMNDARCFLYYGLLLNQINDTTSSGLEYIKKSADFGVALAQFHCGNILILSHDENQQKLGIEYLTKAHAQNNIDARILLATCYFYGNVLPQNQSKAFDLIKPAAENGNLLAIMTLGDFYKFSGKIDEAFPFYLKAAELGDVECKYIVGWYYCFGINDFLSPSPSEAEKWLLEACEQNHIPACSLLGQGYLHGSDNFPLNIEKGFSISKIAADGNCFIAQYYVALYYLGYYYDYDYSKVDFSPDLQKAFHYFTISADKGKNPNAQCELGYWYLTGDYLVDVDIEKAVHYFKLSAEKDHSIALYNLGYCYAHGTGVDLNISKAFDYYLKSAKLGYIRAKSIVGEYLHAGTGVKQDKVEAKKWFTEAANEGDVYSQSFLGNMEGDEGNLDGFLHWHKLAVSNNDPYSQYNLGYYYCQNDDNYDEGVRLLQLAAEQDHSESQLYLADIYSSNNRYLDIDEALRLYSVVAERGDPDIQHYLGFVLITGKFGKKDINTGLEWLHCAAKQGYEPSIKLLADITYLDNSHNGEDYEDSE